MYTRYFRRARKIQMKRTCDDSCVDNSKIGHDQYKNERVRRKCIIDAGNNGVRWIFSYYKRTKETVRKRTKAFHMGSTEMLLRKIRIICSRNLSGHQAIDYLKDMLDMNGSTNSEPSFSTLVRIEKSIASASYSCITHPLSMEQFCFVHGWTNHLPNRITPRDSRHLENSKRMLVKKAINCINSVGR